MFIFNDDTRLLLYPSVLVPYACLNHVGPHILFVSFNGGNYSNDPTGGRILGASLNEG